MNAQEAFFALVPYIETFQAEGLKLFYRPRHYYLLMLGESTRIDGIVMDVENSKAVFQLADTVLEYQYTDEFTHAIDAFDLVPVFSVREGAIKRSQPKVDTKSEIATFPFVTVTQDVLNDLATKSQPGEIVSIVVRTAMPLVEYPKEFK